VLNRSLGDSGTLGWRESAGTVPEENTITALNTGASTKLALELLVLS
jgi:hypothetical protein